MIVAHGLLHDSLFQWTLEPLTIASLAATSVLYGLGVRALWRRAGRWEGVTRWQVAAFAGGILSLAFALVSPVAWLSERIFSAHMTQHEVLMLVSAPLLVVAEPLLACLWAFPRDLRVRIAALFRTAAFTGFWQVLTAPLCVFVVHGLTLWIWHIPSLFERALESEPLRVLQHLSFFLTAALFWWGMIHGRYGRAGYGVAVLYVFLTTVHSSLLGALMALTDRVWYPSYIVRSAGWPLDAIADQQLAGLLMWVPSGAIFIVVGLALLSAWLGESERRAALSRTAEASRARHVS